VRQAEDAVTAQAAQLRIASSQNLPSIALSSTYGRVAYPASGLPGWNDFLTNWNVAVGLQWPLFTGGRIKGDRIVAQAGLDEARLHLQQAAESAALDTRSALEQLASAREVLAASDGTVTQAGRAYDIAELRFREGISTHTELLDARLALEQARANRAQASRDVQVARIRLALLPRLPLGGTATGAAATTTRSTTRQATATQASGSTGFGIP
jgi:outer membrane protein TolC